MALNQNDIDELERAIASGTRRIKFTDGREREFNSVSELKEALSFAKSQVNKSVRAPYKPTFSRGYQR